MPAEDIPAGREERITWLYDWWDHIDDWVAQNRPTPLGGAGRS
ncbi:hypothetical protein GCM10009737_03280 [Nocardioides lentus]|uniref:Uncharacterized protein n=1 Tax=Nocardioides lentus TaxID=338077 RepID=A0ABP5A7B1_9ACTN